LQPDLCAIGAGSARLSVPSIAASVVLAGMGGGARFTHAANHQAGLVIRSALFRLPVRLEGAPVPHMTYTDPELAAVGLAEALAEAHSAIRVLRWAFADNDRPASRAAPSSAPMQAS